VNLKSKIMDLTTNIIVSALLTAGYLTAFVCMALAIFFQ